MNTSQSTAFLKNKGYSVNISGDKYTVSHPCWCGPKEYSARELVKLAMSNRDSGSQPSLGKNLKSFSNSKDRAATRDALNSENFDIIPSNSRTREDSRWNWD